MQLCPARCVHDGYAPTAPQFRVNGYVVLHLATLIVLIPIDFLLLGTVAKGFFTSEVGDMLGEIFCYSTFELTSLSLLKRWTWPVVMVDVIWGTFVTAVSSTADDRQLDRAQDLSRSLRTEQRRSNPCFVAWL